MEHFAFAALLSISIAIQLCAAYFSIRNTSLTPAPAPWLLISAAIVLMAVRRIITLTGVITEWETPRTVRWGAELTALVISITMLTGMVLLRRVLKSMSFTAAQQKQLFRESLHTSKNNLQSLESLLSTRASFTQSSESHDLLVELSQKVAAYSLLQEELFEHDAEIVSCDYVGRLVSSVETAYTDPDRFLPVQREYIDIPASPREVLHLGLLISEALINCFKHSGHSDHRVQVRVACGVDGDRQECQGCRWATVSDDGPGFPPAVLDGGTGGFGLAFMAGMSGGGWTITWGNAESGGAWVRVQF